MSSPGCRYVSGSVKIKAYCTVWACVCTECMVLHVQDSNRLYSSAVTATDLHHGHDGYHHDWDGVNGTHNGTFWGHYHHHGHGCRFFLLSVLFLDIIGHARINMYGCVRL